MLNNRIIYSDNGTLIDVTEALNNFHSLTETLTLVAAEDAIYIGGLMPFNHRFFQMAVVNAAASRISIDLWDGKGWEPAADILDQTLDSTRTKTLSRSGQISWALDRNKGWAANDTEDMTGSGLQTLKITGLYWARIKFTANLTAAIQIQFIGHLFSRDEDLGSLYPDLNTTEAKTQFNNGVAGKTTWDEQAAEAARVIIRDLQNLGVIVSEEQLIRWDLFNEASIHKTAEIIFNSQGDDAKDNKDAARIYYKEALSRAVNQVDMNKNTRLDEKESVGTSSLRRR